MWSTGRFSTPKLLRFHPHLCPFQDLKAFLCRADPLCAGCIMRAQSHRFLIYLWEENHWFIVPRNVRCISTPFQKHLFQEILKSLLSYPCSHPLQVNFCWILLHRFYLKYWLEPIFPNILSQRCQFKRRRTFSHTYKTKVHQVRRCGWQVAPGSFPATLPRAEPWGTGKMWQQRPRCGLIPWRRPPKNPSQSHGTTWIKKGPFPAQDNGFLVQPFLSL